MTETINRAPRVFFNNGTYLVTASLLSAPRRFYPIANTTARIRRDPLWLAAGVVAFVSLATAVYGDLLYVRELCVMWGVAVLLLAAGMMTAILHVDAVGHRNALVFGPARRVQALYRAIRDARMHAGDTAVGVAGEPANETSEYT